VDVVRNKLEPTVKPVALVKRWCSSVIGWWWILSKHPDVILCLESFVNVPCCQHHGCAVHPPHDGLM
jgi:hypothetical protein